MKPFEYVRAGSAQDAVGAGAEGRFLGGGTNLVDLMKLEIEKPDRLVDVSRLGSDEIEDGPDGLRIGAGVSNSALAGHPLVRERYPLLSTALLSGATQQLRNKATVGGNFLQRTRCQYFYDVFRACNKRVPGSGCDALDGLNRFHAILGASQHCIAVHPSDMAVAMAALDAAVETLKPDGSARRIPTRSLQRLPGETPQIDHVLEAGELITHVVLPASPPGRQLYRKVRDRSSYAFAVVSIAAAFDLEDGQMTNARIALGGVAHKPWRADRAEGVLEGGTPDAELFAKAADAELAEAVGQGHNDFKIDLSKRLIIAALRDLTEGKREIAA